MPTNPLLHAVAAVVLRAVRSGRPPAVVLVPRWFRAVQLVDALSPQWVRDRARRIVKLEIPTRNSDRQHYLERVQRQLDASAASEHDR